MISVVMLNQRKVKEQEILPLS